MLFYRGRCPCHTWSTPMFIHLRRYCHCKAAHFNDLAILLFNLISGWKDSSFACLCGARWSESRICWRVSRPRKTGHHHFNCKCFCLVHKIGNREFKIEERGRREARPEVRITIWSSLRMTKMSTLARVGALLFFTDVIPRCSALLVKREYFDGLYCFFYVSVSTVWGFVENVRVFC